MPNRVVAAPLLSGGEVMVEVADIHLPVRVRRHARARRLVLRVSANCDALLLTMPPGVPLAEGLTMIQRERSWIERRLRALPQRQPFIDGASIPLLGETVRIRQRLDRPRGVARVGDTIEVGGPQDYLAARLIRWLRDMALRELTARSAAKAGQLGRSPRSVRVREMRSRWGSCSLRGDITYNWRLIMAPPAIVDYVAAHEVAHLACHGHDAAFWATVGRLTNDVTSARHWLRSEGNQLLRYG